MTPEQQRDVLDYTYNLLTAFNHGVPPKGNVAPWWQTSKEGVKLLLEKGIEYGMPKLCDMILLCIIILPYRSLEHVPRVRI